MDRFILGNWKMHGTQETACALATGTNKLTVPPDVRVAVFPPFTALTAVASRLSSVKIKLGAQNCSINIHEGAFTGDISAHMLKDAGCTYVILGHSERRSYHHEKDDAVKRKSQAALDAGLIPVICVGESQEERDSGRHLQAVTAQVRGSLPSLTHSDRMIIAYEPVWAIGSGAVPTLSEITEMHKTIASLLTYDTSGARTAIVYGGSVKAANAGEILSADAVDGVLVGGASLKTEEFGAIITAAGQR